MPFIQYEKTPRSAPSPSDIMRATELRKAVATKRNRVSMKSKSHAWAHEFRKLRLVDGISPDRIKTVCKWYCKHLGEPLIPLAFSGKAFRQQFRNIEAAMEQAVRQKQ